MTAKGTLPTPLPMATRLEAKRLWEAGESYNAVAAELNVAVSSIKTWRSRDKWTRTKPEAGLAIVPESSDVEIPEDLSEQAAQYEEDMRVTALKFSNHVKNLPPDQIAAKADRIKSLDGVNRKALRIESEKPQTVIQLAVLASSPARLAKTDDGRLRSTHRPAQLIEAE